MRIEIDPLRPNCRLLEKVAKIIQNDGVAILPTDTCYAFACSIQSKKAMRRVYQLKEIDLKQPLTFLSKDVSQLQNYIQAYPNSVYRQLKTITPGRNTFIFKASKATPGRLLNQRKQIGIRIPESQIVTMMIELLEEVLLISSVPKSDPEDTHHDPEGIYDEYGKQVDCMIDIGEIFIHSSSVIDFSDETPTLIRQGDSDTSWLV